MDPRIRIHPKMSWIRNTAIRKCLQSLNYVFKLIVASRQLFARATGGQNQEGFRSEVHLLFKSFNRMLSYQSDQVGSVLLLLLNFLMPQCACRCTGTVS
jgi:hypothetical protein